MVCLFCCLGFCLCVAWVLPVGCLWVACGNRPKTGKKQSPKWPVLAQKWPVLRAGTAPYPTERPDRSRAALLLKSVNSAGRIASLTGETISAAAAAHPGAGPELARQPRVRARVLAPLACTSRLRCRSCAAIV